MRMCLNHCETPVRPNNFVRGAACKVENRGLDHPLNASQEGMQNGQAEGPFL